VTVLWESCGEFWAIRAAKGEDAIWLAVTHYNLRVSWSTPKSEAVGFSETQKKTFLGCVRPDKRPPCGGQPLGSLEHCCSGNVAVTVVSVAWCVDRNRVLHKLNCYFHCEQPHRNCRRLFRAQGVA